MRFEEWEPIYRNILCDMGYNHEEDERSANVLASHVKQQETLTTRDVELFFKGQTVNIVGAAPGLELVLENGLPPGKVVAAGSATRWMLEAGILPDMVVTDLDGDVEFQMEAFDRGAIAVIHAHGDNILSIEKYVPQLKKPLLGTTQSQPFPPLKNYGGFTDGDRAVCMASHHGARIRLIGFDFQNPREDCKYERAVKMKKLKWAERIIHLCMDGTLPIE